MGLVHSAKGSSSSRHSKLLTSSLAVNEKSAAGSAVGSGGCSVIVVVGAVRSIRQMYLAAGPCSPFAVARTRKMCSPSFRGPYVIGLPQRSKRPSSSLHSNPRAPSAEKENAASALALGLGGIAPIAATSSPAPWSSFLATGTERSERDSEDGERCGAHDAGDEWTDRAAGREKVPWRLELDGACDVPAGTVEVVTRRAATRCIAELLVEPDARPSCSPAFFALPTQRCSAPSSFNAHA